ncbi:MAG: KH domain-containing protein [Caldilineaceae bacterium]|nr:KH domain-containing protein [Caldilineaceae bacterium]
MKELVEFMAKALVEAPDEVHVSERAYRERVVLRLQVAPEDAGRVIGKNGRVANAMRSVLKVASVRQSRDVILKIM